VRGFERFTGRFVTTDAVVGEAMRLVSRSPAGPGKPMAKTTGPSALLKGRCEVRRQDGGMRGVSNLGFDTAGRSVSRAMDGRRRSPQRFFSPAEGPL